MAHTLHAFTADNRDLPGPRGRVDRSFHMAVLRGEAARCRLARHRPRIGSAGRFRWVECSRCLTRPDPPLAIEVNDATPADVDRLLALARRCRWAPRRADLSAQLVIRPERWTAGLSLTADGPGGEHDMGLHLAVPGAALYLQAAGIGRRFTARMEPGAEREVRVEAGRGYLWWKLWTDRRCGWVGWADLLLGAPAVKGAVVACEPCIVTLPCGACPATATLHREVRRRNGPLGRLLGSRRRFTAWVELGTNMPVPERAGEALGGGGVDVPKSDLANWVAVGVAHVTQSALTLLTSPDPLDTGR